MSKILIKNIYYMLSYACQTLQEQQYANLATEEFENAADLFAAILAKGISNQLKRGLAKEYISTEEELSSPKGKYECTESMKALSGIRGKAVCKFDEYSENILLNEILKSTIHFLIACKDVSKENKRQLKKEALFLENVDVISLKDVKWKSIRITRNYSSYKLLLNICYLVVEGLLISQESGEVKFRNILDEQRMCRLYEKFLLGFYQKEYPEFEVWAAGINWDLTDEEQFQLYLPTMQTDVTLVYEQKALILDAKYYEAGTPLAHHSQWGNQTLHSNNLYQIFTYTKNFKRDGIEKVAGCLMYAKNEDSQGHDLKYEMGGNEIMVRTLDLNVEFGEIKKELKRLVSDVWGR